MYRPLALFALLAPATASAYRVEIEGTCNGIPSGVVIEDFTASVQQTFNGSVDTHLVTPDPYGEIAGDPTTFPVVSVYDNGISFPAGFVPVDGIELFDASTSSFFVLASSNLALYSSTAIPADLVLADFDTARILTGGLDCGPIISVITSPVGGSFVETTIEADLGDVLDASEVFLRRPETIEARLADLEVDAIGQGCTIQERWAGTWRQQRASRLAGATEGGGTISGNLAVGDVDGLGFTANLQSGGRLSGTVADGDVLTGYFTRLSGRRAFWYGIRATCP